MTLAAGSRLGPYEILATIGAGGMGEVYRARDPRLEREVALKVLPTELSGDRDRLARFEHEARAASALNHPNIITIYDIGQDQGITYIVMELVDGRTLREILAAGPLDPKQFSLLSAQIADGLAKAHAAGIVHRDLKPDNVMVTRDGFVKILDFGLAKRPPLAKDGSQAATFTRGTEPGTVMGTVEYMSPEQATGRPVDHRSDQFSLGAVLYEMAAGRKAFHRSSPIETLSAILKEDPEPLETLEPSMLEPLRRIVFRCLAKDPEGRYGSTRDLAHDLREIGGSVSRSHGPRPRGAKAFGARTALIAVAALALALAIAVLLARSRGGQIDSVAVLPLETPPSDPETEYLGQGIADSLIQSLSRLPDLRVIARSSVARYKGQAVDPQKIGKELGVQAVLTGTVTQRGDHLEVSAELVDAGRNAHLWGERYDRKFTDIMSVEQEIAHAVAERLRPKRSADGAGRGGGSTADPAAYQAYLKGRYHWNKRSDADFKKAIDYFRESIDKDPAYAAAYAGLADTWIGLGWYGYVPPRDGYTRARAAAQKAIEIDPSLAEAHASLAAIAMWYDWDWSVSQREFAKMLELNPNYATGRHWHADLLLMQGQHAEAIAEGKKALELDPLSLIINSWLGRRYYFARRYDDAVRECRKALELDPNFAPAHWQLGNALREQKRLPEALAELETAVRLSNGNQRYLAYLGHGRAKAGDAAGARAALDQLTLLAEKGYVSAHDRAVVYAGLGENDRALEWLEKAFEERPSLLPYLNVEPLWDGLRGDPRFQGMIARLGLEQTRVPSPSR